MVVIQWKMLNREVSSILGSTAEKEEERHLLKNDVEKCVNYHNFLINYIKRLNETVWYPNMLMVFFSVTAICVEIFIIVNRPTEGDFLTRLMYLVEDTYEFVLFYIIPGQLLTNEAENMKDFAYMSNWYEHSVEIKKPFINMVTCISNRPVTLNAGNFLDFNFRTAHEAIIKVTVVFINYKETAVLINETKLFWSIDDFKFEEERSQAQFTLKILKFFAIWYPAVGSVTAFFVLFGPIVFQKRVLPLTNFVPDFPPYIFLYILQGYSFLIVYTSIIFFDILFGTLLMMIVIQWKFLNLDITRVLSSNVETAEDQKLLQREIKKCIDYHIFLIDPPGDDFLIHITLLMGLTNEYLLFYVIPGQLLSDEAENTENSAFSSIWYENSTNLKKPMVNMISNISRKSVNLTAAKLFDFTFENALKAENTEKSAFSSIWYESSTNLKKPMLNMISNISRKSVNLTAAKLFDFTFENALKSYKLVFSYYMFLKTMNIGKQEK
ncbi:unnamed protein product [Diabrotica balteata]|uniref:Odorant receptor n=1 Tax=Diabrotica balteata TaxID=107213 RepID=A0A9N9X7Q4_DIABA|nr:unnamed protein product [Diabrotica balteata]